ncbi:MAG: hypothetical protein ACKVS9_11010 [Phycisphaerae bacterium]
MRNRTCNRNLKIAAAAWLAAAGLFASAENADLRVSRVAVFSSGVSYFECDAEVADNATAELTFRTDQINDIIKSLMVQDLGGGRVGVVGYSSRDPVEKTLRSFGVDITGKPTLAQLLDQLRGEPVSITGKRTATGTILGVEKVETIVGDSEITQDVLNLLTDGGVVQMKLADVEGLKLTNEKIDGELRKALATLAGSRDAGKKTVALRFDGQGKRKVRVAYLLEAPIWKTSYRLVMSPEGKPFLQGWATVENATEEDWKDVQLSLVSGRPISFTMDLYTPLYIPRPREELELYASLRPPEYDGAIADRMAVPAAPATAAMAGRGLARGGRGGAREDADLEMAENKVFGGTDGRREFAMKAVAAEPGAGVESVANAEAAGELFQYVINVPVSIGRQHSAMLPIVNQPIEGEKVSIYNPATHPKHPLNGLQLKNTSGLNLMQGPVTVFDGGVYAGDAKLPNLKPDEKRLVGYALDLGVEVTQQQQASSGEIVSLKIAKGVLIHRHKYVDDRVYQIKNKEQKPRTLIIEQAYGDEWKLVQPAQPDERTAQLSRFKVTANPMETTPYAVKLEQLTDQSVTIAQLSNDQIAFYVRSKAISKAVTDALEKIIAMRVDFDASQRSLQQLEKSVNEAVGEQARVRENLKTLAAGSDAHKRQQTKFDDIETQIESLRKSIAAGRDDVEKKRVALEQYLLGLSVE